MPPPSRTFCPEFTSKVFNKKGLPVVPYRQLGKSDVIFVQYVQLPACVCVLHRGGASGGEDEEAGSKVRPSPPRASNREVGNPAGEFNTTLSLRWTSPVCYVSSSPFSC